MNSERNIWKSAPLSHIPGTSASLEVHNSKCQCPWNAKVHKTIQLTVSLPWASGLSALSHTTETLETDLAVSANKQLLPLCFTWILLSHSCKLKLTSIPCGPRQAAQYIPSDFSSASSDSSISRCFLFCRRFIVSAKIVTWRILKVQFHLFSTGWLVLFYVQEVR